jgi:hypothetical protein
VLVAEVGEGVELIEDTTNCFGFGEVATTGDLHDISILGGMDRLPIRALPGAVVDFVGGSEALVVFSIGFGDFDTGHVSGFGVSRLDLLWSSLVAGQFFTKLDLAWARVSDKIYL